MKLRIDAKRRGPTIDRNIYGHFSEHLGRCIYGGYWVGENSPIQNTRGVRNDVVKALKDIRTPVVRWPGGCFADDYHWMDGIGPREDRPTIVNMHWGGVTEDNSFGTHEFMDLCEQLDCDAYICGNVGSGSVREMRDWVEYLTFEGRSPMSDLRVKNGREKPWRVRFFGVGNETWGCGGNMRAEYYADEYKRYATYIRNYGPHKVEKIAVGPSEGNRHWTEVMMREAAAHMDGLSLHCYTIPTGDWKHKGPATGFSADEWYGAMRGAHRMADHIRVHSAAMDLYDPQARVYLAVDEWGAWYDVEPGTNPGFLYQQNSLRDALIAGYHLNLFNNNAHRVRMANIAQTINVLQAVLLTEGDKMLLTPTYHVFDLFKGHQDATLLPVDFEECAGETEGAPKVTVSASQGKDGVVRVTLTNISLDQSEPVSIELSGFAARNVRAMAMYDGLRDAHNTFDKPDRVAPRPLEGVQLKGSVLTGELPPASVVLVELLP